MRVRRLANQARREGRTNTVDIKVFEERKFYTGKGLRRTKGSESGSDV
jgi:hypothetical protein